MHAGVYILYGTCLGSSMWRSHSWAGQFGPPGLCPFSLELLLWDHVHLHLLSGVGGGAPLSRQEGCPRAGARAWCHVSPQPWPRTTLGVERPHAGRQPGFSPRVAFSSGPFGPVWEQEARREPGG